MILSGLDQIQGLGPGSRQPEGGSIGPRAGWTRAEDLYTYTEFWGQKDLGYSALRI